MAADDFPGRSPVLLTGTLALTVIAGLAAALAQPPWGFLPGLFGFGVLMRQIDRLSSPWRWKGAFGLGWLAGLGYFVPSLIWLAQPFQVDADAQGWMAPFAVGLMAMGMALFWGTAGVLYRLLARRGPSRVLLFAAAFALFEWLRGHVLTGLPWDLPGESWRAGSAPSQGAALVGAYGMTWLTIVAAAAPFTGFEGRSGRVVALGGVAVVAGLYAFGAGRLAASLPIDPHGPRVRIVQADVEQESKYDRRIFTSIVGRYVALTGRPPADGRWPDIVVWPEGAIPAALDEYLGKGAWPRDLIGGAMRPGQTLILGGYRYGAQANGVPVAYNSLAALRLGPDGPAIVGLYDKFRLVPFGEFMPLDSVASRWGIKQFVHVGDGFTPGPPPRPLKLPGLPIVQPLICYESLFPGFTREGGEASGVRAAWIANISNDAWFGKGVGPRQHLNLASYRAIEEGLPMVRATPTGVSAIIDAYGRIVPGESLGMAAYGVIDGTLPPALASTLFNRLGDTPFLVMLIVSLSGAAVPGRARRLQRP
jgi:apolipoprotein N-acyltransferase